MSLVIIDYEDLISDKNLADEIIRAYGADSIGALAIRGIPGWTELCSRTLPMGHALASLPHDKLSDLEDEASMYNAGWSLGKEKMGDTPDFAKASFYFNPITDDPNPELREAYPWAVPPNKWPNEEDIPGFKANCCEVGRIMKETANHLTRHIDNLLTQQVPGYKSGLFYNSLVQSTKCKSRMLYYYPIKPSPESSSSATTTKQSDNWIAWHNDSGFLTCLAPEKFLNHETGEVIDNPEPETAGLWIAQRDGNERKIFIPSDCK
jgi:isopenicillin N synthase-like dioxygenase